MARELVADYGRELTDLKSESSVLPGSKSQGVLVEAKLSSVITRIKTSIQTRLNKSIDLRPDLSVEKQRQPRIEKVVYITINESGRRLLKMISLKIDRAPPEHTRVIVERGYTALGVPWVEHVSSVQGT